MQCPSRCFQPQAIQALSRRKSRPNKNSNLHCTNLMNCVLTTNTRPASPAVTLLLLLSTAATPSVMADWHSHGSIRRSASVNVHGSRGGHVNVNRNWSVHRDVDIDVHNHDHFWGGVAVGAAASLAVGAIARSLPPKTTTVVVGSQQYYYAAGVYYQTAPAGGYIAVSAPVGAVVAVLPPGAAVVNVGNNSVFYSNGTFYQQQGTAFAVIPAPIGAIVPHLPPGAAASVVNGQTYFLSGGVYYQPVFQNGVTVFTTVKL
jgi:hypothetical protein